MHKPQESCEQDTRENLHAHRCGWGFLKSEKVWGMPVCLSLESHVGLLA